MNIVPKIDSYQFGRIVVDGESHDQDLILLPNQVIGGWWRKEGHALHPEDLDVVFETNPEVLVVGQGAYGRMTVTSEAAEALEAAEIELVVHPTEKACQVYNDLRTERAASAALHLTC